MPNYQNSKIYVLKRTKDDSIFYVGSTVIGLSQRMVQHRCALIQTKSMRYPVYQYINKKGGREAFYIELYKRYPCDSREELNRMEGRVILRLRGKGIKLKNKALAGRDIVESHREYMKKYRKTENYNMAIKKYKKTQKYVDTRQLYEKKFNVPVKCKCGRVYMRKDKARHMRTASHKKIIALQNEESE